MQKVAGDREIAAAFAAHVRETERHRTYVVGRPMVRGFEFRGAPESARITSVGMALFARLQPDTPGKLVAHAFSSEHMELAAHELLARVARRAGEEETVAVAHRILPQERAAAQRIRELFGEARQRHSNTATI